jgi:hypothetical protein
MPDLISSLDVTNATNGTKAATLEMGKAAEDVLELMDEINRRVADGSDEMIRNLTGYMEDKLVRLPEDAADELSKFLKDVIVEIQDVQLQELERQLGQIESRFVKPLRDLAFSDVPLFELSPAKPKEDAPTTPEEEVDIRRELILTGVNSTLVGMSRRMRTKEILQNFNVAPFYYTVTLVLRWIRKASYPSVYLLSLYQSLASIIKSPKVKFKEEKSYEQYVQNAEIMQAGWKRTGDIAARGAWGRKWATLRRSAEIWAYFSSFYLKERRIQSNYKSGRWSDEKFREERSKLGAEVTQNLLKLGPTFIKVSKTCAGLKSRGRLMLKHVAFPL